MTTFITKTGTTKYNKAKFKMNDKQVLRVAACEHNAAVTGVPAANVVNMITVPAGSIILGVALDVKTLDANTQVKIGLTDDDDLFSANTLCTAALTTTPITTTGTAMGQPYYTNAATNVIVTPITNALDTAVFVTRVVYIEMDSQESTN